MIREWIDAKGRKIPIHEMHTQHIESAIKRTYGWGDVTLRFMLIDELQRRETKRAIAIEMPNYSSVEVVRVR